MEAATDKIVVTLPDGKPLELDRGASGADAAAAIGPGLAKAALAIRVDGELRDMSAPLPAGGACQTRPAMRACISSSTLALTPRALLMPWKAMGET